MKKPGHAVPTFLKTTILALACLLTAFSGLQKVYGHEVNKGAIVLLAVKGGDGQIFATGTGFIADPKGSVISNYHVLIDAYSIDAVFQDGRKVPVKGISTVDRARDFCILQLEEGLYSTLEIGDSDKVEDFDYTSALGFLSQEVNMDGKSLSGSIRQTYGFVTGIHPQAYPDFSVIYTTTPFGPGFSGGPLVNQKNQVVGVATVEGRGVNFALPINEVKPNLNQNKMMTFSQLREEDKHSKEYLYFKGHLALYGSGDLKQAVEYFEKALSADPNYILAHYDLAVVYRDMGLMDKTIGQYEKVIALNPRFPEALSNLGGHYFRVGKTEKALELFRQAIQIYPNFIQALSNLGAVLNKTGKPNEAIPYLKRTIKVDPEFAIAHFNLGNSYFKIDQYAQAQESYQKAAEFGLNFLSLHWKLYEIHKREGRSQKAIEELRFILKLDPENQEAKIKLDEMSPAQRN